MSLITKTKLGLSTTRFAYRSDEPGHGTTASSGTSPAHADLSSRCMQRWRVEVYTGQWPPPSTAARWGRVGAWPLMGGGRVVCISQWSIYIALNNIDVIWFMHILSIHLVWFSWDRLLFLFLHLLIFILHLVRSATWINLFPTCSVTLLAFQFFVIKNSNISLYWRIEKRSNNLHQVIIYEVWFLLQRILPL